MRKIAAWILVLGMAAAPAAMADDGAGKDKTSDAKTDKSSTTTTKANATAPTSAELEAEIEQLRALIKEQADQLAAMKAAMPNNGTANSAAASGTGTANTSSVATTAAAAASSPAPMPGSAKSSAPGLSAAAAPAPNPTQAENNGDHSPLSFKIGDAQFTPGGFMDFTGVYRTESTGAGIGSGFNSIPFINTASATAGPAGYGETRFSVQNSRVSLRVDAPVGDAKIAGYVEADFLGGLPANAN